MPASTDSHPNLPHHAQVVAGWADGALTPQIEYELAGTPCAEVLTGVACFYPTGVAERTPVHCLFRAPVGVAAASVESGCRAPVVPRRHDVSRPRHAPPLDNASALRVLVIDDNVDATNALNRLLAALGATPA